jgi:hypothetical protein
MTNNRALTRVLAIDLHPRHFGFVVIENPHKLLDWGVCSSRRKGTSTDVLIRKRLRPLLKMWRPSLLVVRGKQKMKQQRNLPGEGLLARVVAEAKSYQVRIQMLKKPTKARTKYERAQAALERFPILPIKMPTKRKPWESEHYSMSILESLAMATA